MLQKKRHHFVPKTYLNSFCDPKGRLFVYRKDSPQKPLYVKPDATQFRGYYYSQPIPEGGQDNNTLEDLFSTIESKWPDTIARLHRRESINDALENLFEFMTLQRVRVPAARDAVESILAQTVKDTLNLLHAKSELPPLPLGSEDLLNQIQVSIDPHMSIHAMADISRGMGELYSVLGFAAVHNSTQRPFLSSDNPVLWFDPSIPFDKQQPYRVNLNEGLVHLIFPVSPILVLIGATEYADTYAQHGLLHTDAPNEDWVEMINAQICRFAYEAVIAPSSSQEDLIMSFTNISPVNEATTIRVGQSMATVHQMVFGTRAAKPKWDRK
ncbi:MAG TPA: DUF4238 domain-containing protein [Pseudomonas sp.]|nr:DUF4238 domain-containing protein [Pseudomonas sp.]